MSKIIAAIVRATLGSSLAVQNQIGESRTVMHNVSGLRRIRALMPYSARDVAVWFMKGLNLFGIPY